MTESKVCRLYPKLFWTVESALSNMYVYIYTYIPKTPVKLPETFMHNKGLQYNIQIIAGRANGNQHYFDNA